MENPLRKYLSEIGNALGRLGHELCLQSENSDRPLAIHGKVLQALDYVVLNLHNLNADLDIWRKEMLAEYGRADGQNIYDGMDRLDMDTIYWVVCRMLNTHFPDDESDSGLTVAVELRKLEWLLEELQNRPESERHSKAAYEDFCFDRIAGKM